ncbi:hypothetical protein [Saccharicrinis aurantiacus]|uniref:hypothetical protein n=1 Tax=Saccharicrinis aurantiacus TaxID=1849719 RepID=UPI0008383F6D|nr:hypothetical protein [Saccharicrinis aurantiacus]
MRKNFLMLFMFSLCIHASMKSQVLEVNYFGEGYIEKPNYTNIYNRWEYYYHAEIVITEGIDNLSDFTINFKEGSDKFVCEVSITNQGGDYYYSFNGHVQRRVKMGKMLLDLGPYESSGRIVSPSMSYDGVTGPSNVNMTYLNF